MKKVFMFLGACLFGLAVNATEYKVTINNFDLDLSVEATDVIVPVDALLKTGDVVNLTLDGYFDAEVKGVEAVVLIDNSPAAPGYWGQLSAWGLGTEGATTEVGTKFTATWAIEIESDAYSAEKYIVRLKPKVAAGVKSISMRPTTEADPEGTTYTVALESGEFALDDAENKQYKLEQAFVLDAALANFDKVNVTVDGKFNQSVSNIIFMIFDNEGNQVLGWTPKSMTAAADAAVSESFELKISKDCEGTTYKLMIFFQYVAEEGLAFTSSAEPVTPGDDPVVTPGTAVSSVEADALAIVDGVVYSAGAIVVYNVAGQVVATATQALEVSTLQAGVYFIAAQEGTIKFVK